MKHDAALNMLEEAVTSLSIRLDYDDLKKGEVNTHGGAFILKGAQRILIHKHLTPEEKVDALAEILRNLEAEGATFPDEVRSRIEHILPKRS